MPLPKQYSPVTWQNINYQPQDFFNGAIQGAAEGFDQATKQREYQDQILANRDIAAMMRGEIASPTNDRVNAETFLRTKMFSDVGKSELETNRLAQAEQAFKNSVQERVHDEAMQTADAQQELAGSGAFVNRKQGDEIQQKIEAFRREADLIKRTNTADNAIEDLRRRRYQFHYADYMKTNPSAALTEAGQDAANNAAAAAAEIDINQEADSGNLQKILGLSEDIFRNTGLGQSRVVGEMTKSKIEQAAEELVAKNSKAKQTWLEQAPNNFAVFRWNSETGSLDVGDPNEEKLTPSELRNVLTTATQGTRVQFDPNKLSEEASKQLNDLAPYLSSSMARHLGEVIKDKHLENSKVFPGGFGGGMSSDDFVNTLTQEIFTMRRNTPALIAKLGGGQSVTTNPNERLDPIIGFNVKTTDTILGGNAAGVVPVTKENAGLRAKEFAASIKNVDSDYETYKNAGLKTDNLRLQHLHKLITTGKGPLILSGTAPFEEREAALITFNSIIESMKTAETERATKKADDAARDAEIKKYLP